MELYEVIDLLYEKHEEDSVDHINIKTEYAIDIMDDNPYIKSLGLPPRYFNIPVKYIDDMVNNYEIIYKIK